MLENPALIPEVSTLQVAQKKLTTRRRGLLVRPSSGGKCLVMLHPDAGYVTVGSLSGWDLFEFWDNRGYQGLHIQQGSNAEKNHLRSQNQA